MSSIGVSPSAETVSVSTPSGSVSSPPIWADKTLPIYSLPTRILDVSSAAIGASLTGVTLMVMVAAGLSSSPSLTV